MKTFRIYLLATLLVLLAMGQKAFATEFTTTYEVSGSANGNAVTMTLTASGDAIGETSKTYSQSWTNGTDSFIRIICENNNYLEITNPSKNMTVSGNIFSSTGSTKFVYRSASSSFRIKRVQIYYGGSLVKDSYNFGYDFEFTSSPLAFNRIVVTYTNSKFSIDESVVSGVADSYIANGRGVSPVPTITWHGIVLTKGTHYTLDYAGNYTGGNHDATITVTGLSYFGGTITITFGITEVTLSMFVQNGDGSYRISSADDLGLLSALASGGNNAEGLTFKQTCDIAFPYTNAWNDNTGTETNLYPIKTFNGSYDGQGHTISGIRMYFPIYTDNEYIGLFGRTSASGDTGGTIKNINLTNSRFTGYHCVGGIAGSTWKTTIADCCVGEDVAFHAVTDQSNSYGGIVGFNQSTIVRCLSRAQFSKASDLSNCQQWGGIAGHTSSSNIKYCLAIGVTMPYVKRRGAIAGSTNTDPGTANYYLNCTIGTSSTSVGHTPYSSGISGTPIDTKGSASKARVIAAGPGVTIGGKTYTTGCFGITSYDRYPDTSSYHGHTSYNGTVYGGTSEVIILSLTRVADPEGYTFKEFTTSGGEVLTRSYSTYYHLTVGSDDVTISAAWNPHTYTVTFDKNHEDAAGTMEPQAFTYGVEQNLTANAFSREDHTFVRWTTAPDGSGSSYTDGQSVSNLTPEDNGSVTLYAQWQMTGYYDIHLPSDSAGAVTAKVGDDDNATAAHIGNTVTLTVSPLAGHRLTPNSLTAKYTDADNHIQTLELTQDPEDASKYSFTMPDYEVTVSATFQNLDWLALGEAFAAASTEAENPTVITLQKDYIAASGDTYLLLDRNHHLVLDLNGHTINRNLSAAVADGDVIETKSNTTLTIRDGSPGQTGTITGGWSTGTSGCLSTAGTTRLEGGTITGNRVNSAGASAVRFAGQLYITGCTITGNMGNLICNSALMAGAVWASGGSDARLYISDGAIITGNYVGKTYTGSAGLGFYWGIGSGQVHLSGAYTLSGNMQGSYDAGTDTWSDLQPSDYHATSRYRLYLDSAISPTAPAVIILCQSGYFSDITRQWSTAMSGKDPEDYFTLAPYVTDKGIGINSAGEAMISSLHDITVSGYATASLSSAVQGKRITLAPMTGKVITSASYTPEGGSATEIIPSYGVYSFIMPDAPVSVTVTSEDGNSFVLKARPGILDGQSLYWATFYDGAAGYTLPEGAAAYTMSGSKNLYRLGENGRVIPAGTAVVILTDSAAIALTGTDDSSSVAVHGGNILQGSDSAVAVSGLSGTPHVLGVEGSVFGFHPYDGAEIPAHKAYYVQ